MTHRRLAAGTLALVMGFGLLKAGDRIHAQTPARPEPADSAVTALVTEVRALRAEIAAASRNQLRAQMLLGRVQMQEQRLAYLDKQRTDAAAARVANTTIRNQMNVLTSDQCSGLPSAEARRDCEAQAGFLGRQLAALTTRDQELRAQEQDLENAIAAEQARWSEFNTRLDELERALR